MPKFNAEATGTFNSSFSFSAVDISTLGATEYTLVGLVIDASGSVSAFSTEEEAAIGEIINACRKSPRADNLMLRYTRFNNTVQEVHGFKLLQDCNAQDYKNTINPNGMTQLYDASVDGVDALSRYGRDLIINDFTANGILFVITDGQDNYSKYGPTDVHKAIERAVSSEALESLVTVLIGVNLTDAAIAAGLKEYAKNAGFTQFVDIGQADQKTLSRLASFVSRSISSQSQSLGTGSSSQALPF